MSHEIDRAYYRQCAIKERERAEQAADISVRHSHERLAELYERKAEKMPVNADIAREHDENSRATPPGLTPA